MQRYWKLISLISVIVLVIGTFYIQSSMAASRLPEFVLEKVSGDEAEIKQLSLEANYYQNAELGEWFQLNNEGTTYWNEYSYWDRMIGINHNAKIEQLRQDYRKFMRGKSENPYSFHENEELLVYVDLTWDMVNGYQPNDFKLDIAVLDKVSKEETSFQAAIPKTNQSVYSFDVEGIYLKNGQLKVITRNSGHDSQSERDFTNYPVYLIDIATQTIKTENIITAKDAEVSSNQFQELLMIRNKWEDFQQPSDFIVFEEKVVEERMIDEWEITFDTVDRELFVYNLESEDKEQIKLPKELQEDASAEMVIGTTIYFVEKSEGVLVITSYNFESGEIEAKQTIAVPEVADEQGYMYKINDDKVYVVPVSKNAKQDLLLQIVHLKTGDTLYEGKVTMKNPNKQGIDYDLDIQSIDLDN
ncbi:hypothetical protein [Oceanobacillus polygoni]|uniref:Uncharacterized protein n=2 Tax=Oceanobacillus polygoni TaxID=1235259 RepID=A0A9X0YWH0_9BACI|nr:hypothetical protein [Oceanobacillus polygoni]MBP2079296.1 hypothetical protein [Oceanobacillus polygoni]